MFQEVGMEAIREKSLRLTDYMMMLIDLELGEYNFVISNPRESEKRGGHIFLVHEEAARICKALKDIKSFLIFVHLMVFVWHQLHCITRLRMFGRLCKF